MDRHLPYKIGLGAGSESELLIAGFENSITHSVPFLARMKYRFDRVSLYL